MDGHVEVARLLLDSGAQVNMPADSFESPLTLAACGGMIDFVIKVFSILLLCPLLLNHDVNSLKLKHIQKFLF